MFASTRTQATHAGVVTSATLLAQTVVSMGALTLPVLAPTLGEVLDVDASTIGYQISIVYAGAMISSALGGQIVARLGACRTTQAALGLVGVPLGGMAAALIAPYLAQDYGWRVALAFVFLAASLGLLLLQPARVHWDDDRERGPQRTLASAMQHGRAHMLDGIRLVWRARGLRALSLMALCFAGVQLCLMTFTVNFLVKEAGYTLIDAGLLLSMVQFSGALGRIAWGWLADRLRASRATLLVLGALMWLATVAVTQIDGQWAVGMTTAVFMVMGATAIGWNGVFLAEVARLAPAGQVSVATGGALFFTFGGVLIGPSVFAATYAQVHSYAGTFVVAAILVTVGLLFLLNSGRRPAAA